MGTAEVEQFLTHLAVHDRISASSQNQALNLCRCSTRPVRTNTSSPTFASTLPSGRALPFHCSVARRTMLAEPPRFPIVYEESRRDGGMRSPMSLEVRDLTRDYPTRPGWSHPAQKLSGGGCREKGLFIGFPFATSVRCRVR